MQITLQEIRVLTDFIFIRTSGRDFEWRVSPSSLFWEANILMTCPQSPSFVQRNHYQVSTALVSTYNAREPSELQNHSGARELQCTRPSANTPAATQLSVWLQIRFAKGWELLQAEGPLAEVCHVGYMFFFNVTFYVLAYVCFSSFPWLCPTLVLPLKWAGASPLHIVLVESCGIGFRFEGFLKLARSPFSAISASCSFCW